MSILNPYSTTITEIDPGHCNNDHDTIRLVVVEQDVEIPHGQIDLHHWFNVLAGLTNWSADADYHYAGRGGLVINLDNVSSNKLRDDVIWALTQGCKRFGYQPNLTLPFGMPESGRSSGAGGRHVNIAVLNRDYYGYDRRSPQERLNQHLQLHYGLFCRRPEFPLLSQLASGTGYVTYGGRGEMLDEMIVITAAGTRAFKFEIVDEDERAALDYDMVD